MTADSAAVVETHVSVVFFAGDRAYKLLKPVDLGFLDHTDTSVRIKAAQRELELNRRMAPDVYLGTADVIEHGEVTDRMIVMRRLPSERRMSALVDSDGFSRCITQVARTVASFHARMPPHPRGAQWAGRDALAANWADNLSELRRIAPSMVEQSTLPSILDDVEALSGAYLHHRGGLFEQRIEAGMVRDGHGDLLADDIFCLPDGPRILDCLAFREDLRVADVLADIGFLAMDLHRIAGPDSAASLLQRYVEFSGEHHPESLAHHYIAYRAGVRAKVTALRWEQTSGGARTAAEALVVRFLELCLHHLRRAEVHLVLVGGGPGSGKSTLSQGLANRLGWMTCNTDELRSEVMGSTPTGPAPPGEGTYTPERTAAVYARLLDEAAALVEAGESVILDASWTRDTDRRSARELARRLGATLTEIECRLDAQVAKERVVARRSAGPTLSEATPEVVDYLLARRDPWPEARVVDTDLPPSEVADLAAERLTAGWQVTGWADGGPSAGR